MGNTLNTGTTGIHRGFIRKILTNATLLACLTALCFALCASPAGAQLAGKGGITGTVNDNTGAVIPDATVTATNEASGIVTTIKTTGAGTYNFSNLDPGIYTVTVTAKGFEKLVQKNIHVNATEQQAYNPVLTVGATSTEIVVTAEPPQLETTNATLGATMENEVYSELPVMMGAYGQADQRRATDFAYLMPGVQGNMTNGNATTNTGVVNGSGSRGAVSAVYIDGIPFVRAGGNGDPRYVWTAISVDAVEQFQVQTVGASAIYEGQGVMNYSIKQGGSKYHVSVYEFLRNTAFDTWGFWKTTDPTTNKWKKPVEHNNEYGINISGPLVPFGSWKNKLFFFGNYNGYRYTSENPTPISLPTEAEKNGDFSNWIDPNTNLLIPIYDPYTQAACTANSTDGPCRYQYGYSFSGTKGPHGGPTSAPTGPVNVIPSSEFSAIAKAMQQFLPTVPTSAGIGNNYIGSNPTGLSNWSTTERIDYTLNANDSLSLLAAIGRQASSVPVGQSTSGRNIGPVPYNYGQAYAPKTAVGAIEETHTFSPYLLNQFKWGFARYDGPTISPNRGPKYAATAMGISGLPAGQAQETFPIVTFSGNGSRTNWGGTTENLTLAQNFSVLDNLQWNTGKHSLTFGAQVAWMQYNVVSATGGSTPLTLAIAVGETAGFTSSSNSKPTYVAAPGTGLAYASFLTGQIDKGSFTSYLQPETGTRFRAISEYVQDNWKVTPKLTLDLGLRYDFFPTLTEVNNIQSFFDPNVDNPITGAKGGLMFAGHGANTCNCSTPVKNQHANFGPRIGVAYQIDPKTVFRGSYGVMYTHGGGVGGGTTSLGVLGFSAAPSFSSVNNSSTMPGFFPGGNGAVPNYKTATGRDSGPAYGTGYTRISGYTGTPSTMGYADPYIGGVAPQFINWSFGFQRQVTNALALTATYVGSEGHHLIADSSNAVGYWSNQLDPKYLQYGSNLALTGTNMFAFCTANNLSCPSSTVFSTSQPLSTALKPFPYQGVSNTFSNVSNANYHALQLIANMRAWHGLTINSNFTWSKAIDNGGTFRSGYAIPAGTIANHPNASYKADRMDRAVSTTSQPLHFVATTVWTMPFGRSVFNGNAAERAVLGGFKLSGVFQAFSGSPLALTENSSQTNPAQSSNQPIMNPNFHGSARQNGKWGHGVTMDNYKATTFIVPSTGSNVASAAGPFMNPVKDILNDAAYSYKFSDAPRTAPYNLYGPGNYQLDLAMVRTFPLHFTESAKLNFRAEWYNVTNHTFFAVASTAVGSTTFGQVTNNPSANRKAAQFSARIEF